MHAGSNGPFSRIEEAVDAIRAGRMVIVVDDEDRENEGDLTIAAEKVTPEAINFMAKYGRGLICVSLTPERLDELDIPLDGHAEHRALRHRVLRAGRSEGPDDHRHFGRRSRRDGAGADRSGDASGRSRAARPHVSRCARGPAA